ncbi:LuxR C-terminal-related transcriptional regulator [Oscillatoria sp. FACHB-1406]|uniref:LuxR C-terminal-related transcriptional regulator n=1 Tax=Oscillatoria sp. FACHB-1406 TaxID=2692846 RepID=UPI001682B501|nr:LuxR C-terminal-related transcriptional regulator [Oscillatoria sp. FACHB-1406]MBD2576350.1 LuxR family transcriptional regulator [Oscillatoria sp. FACHB-1406]
MTISLKLLFEEIHQAKDENDLRSHLAPKIGEYFAAKRSGVFFFDRLLGDRKFQPILNLALSLEHNPVARYIAERHTPVHEELVTTHKSWKLICPRPDHWHVMAGPIVDRGQIVGSVGCTREKSMPAFNSQDLADLSAICLHLSAWTARSATLKPLQPPLSRDRLTPRELQIADLVASGRTNAEIGNELWITENSVKQALKRMFRKLKVSSRTEMVAQLFATELNFKSAKQSS